MHAWVFSTVATDALVQKHQAINADKVYVVLDQFYIKILYLLWTTWGKYDNILKKKWPSCLSVNGPLWGEAQSSYHIEVGLMYDCGISGACTGDTTVFH